MRYLALATDYDGTLATHGTVEPSTLDSIERLRASGRRLIMVTGRELADLQRVFDHLALFDAVVVENGATLYLPATREERLLADPPPPSLAARLRERGVDPLSVGRVIVATWEPNQHAVLETIRELGLEQQVIFNKGAVMILPAGVNKATGLAAAARALGISLRNIVGVGDAENDHAFLKTCELSVAVANALPSLQAEVDRVTHGARGDGVRELVDDLLARDPNELPALARHGIELGAGPDGAPVTLQPTATLLIAGQSGSGKSTVAIALLERFSEKGYQFCLVDPEGDHDNVIEDVVTLGSATSAPTIDEVAALAGKPGTSLTVNLLAVPLAERPAFFAALLPHLTALRARCGAPHWIVVDEAHHMLPAHRPGDAATMPAGLVMVTVHPGHLPRELLPAVDAMIGVGAEARAAIADLCAGIDAPPPPSVPAPGAGEVLLFVPRRGTVTAVTVTPSRAQHLRHRRKYAQGELGEDKSFYFRGPDGALNLRAQNLFLFLQIGDGVDDATWDHHLRAGDYERWFRDDIKDPELADEVAALAADRTVDAAGSRRHIRELVEARYTAPA